MILFKYLLLTLLIFNLVSAQPENNILSSLGLSILQLILGLVLAIATIYIGVKLFDKLTHDIDEFEELKKGNAAVGLIVGAIILSISMFIQSNLLGFTYILSYDLTLNERIFGLFANIVSLVISVLLGILSIYIGVKIFDTLTEGINELKELKKGNLAVGLLLGAVVLSYSILIRNSASNLINRITLSMAVPQQINVISFAIADLFLTMFVSIIMLVLAIKLFYRLTQNIDEVYELKKGNIAVGLLMSAVIFSFALLVEPSTSAMFDKIASQLDLIHIIAVLLIDIVKLAFTVIVAVISIYLSIRILDTLTHDIDEMNELHHGNVSMAIMIAMVILAVSFVMQTGISNLNNAVVPNTDEIISILGIK